MGRKENKWKKGRKECAKEHRGAKFNRYIKSCASTPLPVFDLSTSPTFDVNPSNFTTKIQQSKAKQPKLVFLRNSKHSGIVSRALCVA
jgi:hypothetical protein